MIRRRIASIAVLGAAGAALTLAGCGSSDTTTTAAPAETATASTSTTAVAKTIPCVGAEEACSVKVPLGGGAANERIAIELTGTNMGEPTIEVDPEYQGAYDISDAEFTTGGSIYAFTLDAVESIPEGVNLEMTFAQKG
ncbi:MAG: hypothetical protein O3B97_00415 [Actinomycetota bacterium]|nr:hypothetical protein [Actinomycetota bacterium]